MQIATVERPILDRHGLEWGRVGPPSITRADNKLWHGLFFGVIQVRRRKGLAGLGVVQHLGLNHYILDARRRHGRMQVAISTSWAPSE